MGSEQMTAAKLYPVAAIYLGSFREARTAVTEAIAAADRKQTDHPEEEALSQLLRICQMRAPDKVTEHDFPEDSPLLPLLKLTASGRRNLALHLSEFEDGTAASVRQTAPEEFERSVEKSLRQLTFLQSGIQPDSERLREAVHQIVWTEADAQALREGLDAARNQHAEQTAAADSVREITRKETGKEKHGRTVTLPLWAIIAAALCFTALCAGLILFARTRQKPVSEPTLPAEANSEPEFHSAEFERMKEQYLSIDEAQSRAEAAAGISDADAVFLSTKLKLSSEPVCYELELQDSSEKRYIIKLHAGSGAVLEQQTAESVQMNTEGWIPRGEMRQRVLKTANLKAALFLKEKCETDDQLSLYKYELTDARGRLYRVQLEAKTGALVKYTAEEPVTVNPSDVISVEEAKKKALSRVGDYSENDVIFTKIKFEGSLYLIAFTLDDGTQYSIEIDARNGMTNTVDVHPVSADTSKSIGLLRAREIVLATAGLSDDSTLTFTKAKIDRNNGAYVYELEFETASYEYEVNLDIETGEMMKYRAFSRS